MRALCVGDLHLGAGTDYGREPGDRLRDQEQAWRRALELAAEHDVDAVLFAGDAFHRRRPTPAELIAFQRPLQEFVADTDAEVVAIVGNHDCEAAELPSALDVFGHEVILYSQPGVWHGPGGVAVCCLPWAPVSRLVAARNGGDRDGLNDEAAALLVASARGLRDQVAGPAVLMLHWSISGASTPTGVVTDEFREPVLPYDDLAALGFDAIVAGHIHRAQRLGYPVEVGAPGAEFYTGSPAPVDFSEGAVEHGVWLLDVGEGAAAAEFLPIESRPFVTIDYDPEQDWVGAELEADGLADAVVRVRYVATEEQARRIDHARIAAALAAAGVHKVYAIQPTILREQRVRVAGVDEQLAPMSALELWLEAERLDGWERESLRALAGRYLEAVGA